MKKLYLLIILAFATLCKASAFSIDSISALLSDSITYVPTVETKFERPLSVAPELRLGDEYVKTGWVSPYALPYTRHSTGPDWHRMWINTAVLSGAFIGTLFVLELLPEDATAWNRAAISKTPMFKRWFRNIFKRGPEWDHDNPIFNYVLHPYAGAAYFMSARSCGFSFWGSMLYSAAISTVGWEFGIEAFMERPSYQDIVVTPVVGSLLGELMYRGKRTIVEHGYELLGSPVLGRVACFFLDPVNEVIDLFRGNPAKAASNRYKMHGGMSIAPNGLAMTLYF